MQHITLDKFTGPLDLLLNLIEGEELNISEVSLSAVTEQYFKYLEKIPLDPARGPAEAGDTNRSDELADFLVLATKLVYLKSKNLLPYLYPEPDEGPSLALQLKLYKRYADASKIVQEMWMQNGVAYGRIESPVEPSGFVLPANGAAANLRESFLFLLKRLKPVDPLPEVSIDHSVSIKQKIEAIFSWIKNLTKFSWRDLLGRARNKTDVIVSFLALIQLVNDEKVSIHQPRAFEEMEIFKV